MRDTSRRGSTTLRDRQPRTVDWDLVFAMIGRLTDPPRPSFERRRSTKGSLATVVAEDPFARPSSHVRDASRCAQAGVPPKVVSERLGHATVAFRRLHVYAHAVPDMQTEAAVAIRQPRSFSTPIHGPRQILRVRRRAVLGPKRATAPDTSGDDLRGCTSSGCQTTVEFCAKSPIPAPLGPKRGSAQFAGTESPSDLHFSLVAGAGFEPATFGL